MTTYDVNHTCKDDFFDLCHSSKICNFILSVMIFRYFSFDVDLNTVFEITP